VDAEFTLEQAQELVERHFVSGQGARYEFGNVAETVIPNTLFRFGMNHEFHGEVTLQVYRGLGELGGRLWEQEVHALLRLSSSPHPALPTIIEGRCDEARGSGVGYVCSKSGMDRILPEMLPEIWAQPYNAFRWFALLADGVRQMHAHGLMHRNLWPGALEPVVDQEKGTCTGIRLTTFEMSNLVGNLLRLQVRGSREAARQVSEYYRRCGMRCLACCPRERLSLIFPDAAAPGGRDDFRADIFSLGIVGCQWFFGDQLGEFGAGNGGDGDIGEDARERILAWHDRIRRRLRSGLRGPRELQELLLHMIDAEPEKRYTSSEAVDSLGRDYESIVHYWQAPDDRRPLLLAIAAKRVAEAFVDLGWAAGDAETEVGFEALRETLQADLRGAELVYSPQGALTYLTTGKRSEMALCYWVLIGLQWIYFCQDYRHRTGLSAAQTPIPWALHVRYLVSRTEQNLGRLTATPFRRRLPAIRIAAGGSADLVPAAAKKGHPLWTPYLDDVRHEVEVVAWHYGFRQGLDWLLGYQRTCLEARQYPFLCKERTPDGRAVLVLDHERDLAWREKRPMLNLFASDPRRRPRFGDFFDTLEDRDLGKKVNWQGDYKGEPARGSERTPGRGVMVGYVNAEEIEVRPLSRSEHVPAKGWLRPDQDWASDVLLQRQRNARTGLFEDTALLKQLYQPQGVCGPLKPWTGAAGALRGPARELIPELLATRPFFALQGPPGSGKTDVVATVVKAVLAKDTAARILVSSQSHFALDELAERIIETLAPASQRGGQRRPDGADRIMIRVGRAESETESPIRPAVQAYFPENLAAARVEQVKRRCGKQLAGRDPDKARRELVQRWQKIVDASVLEIRDRLWRGANVVFATCGAATERRVGIRGAFNRFDWVIVEEAARAWLPEVAMPLVHGSRWLLVGDHKQLGPYRQREIMEFLDACKRSPRADLADVIDPSQEFYAALQYFAHLFGDALFPPELATADEPKAEPVARPPVRTLSLQFRMHKTIAEVVRGAFYKDDRSDLATDDSANVAHGVTMPAELAGRPLVWLDTLRLTECQAEERRWKNRGEAELVARLLKRLAQDPVLRLDGRTDRIAVLTPYWDQHDYLSRVVPESFRPFIHIVDSFQGRQADIVIVSLVRTNFQPEDDPFARLGYLASDERINVMLSRARHLLVCVGNHDHFERSRGTRWPEVCRIMREAGVKVTLDADSAWAVAKS
jgi:AAA domain